MHENARIIRPFQPRQTTRKAFAEALFLPSIEFESHESSLKQTSTIMFSQDKKQQSDDFFRRSEMIEKAVAAFSAEFCEKVVTATDERFEALRQRIDRCWKSHVGTTKQIFAPDGVDEFDVYAAIFKGEKYADPKSPGPMISLAGNPIRDLVLAQAMAWGEDKAWQAFETEHQAAVLEIARKRRSNNDYWNDFLAYLGGYDGKVAVAPTRKSRLDGYTGISGLRKWIAKTYFRFLNEKLEQADKNPTSLSEYDEIFHVDFPRLSEAEQEEFQRFFTESLRDSLLSLSRKHRHLLLLLYLFDIKSRQAAQVFGVHEGTISRWKTEAIDMIRENLFERFKQRYGREYREDSQKILSETRALSAKIVFDGLLELLRQLHEEGGEKES